MDEKRCEWCGTVSPAEAEKCTLCRIPFSAPVPPPQDWSHLTGNIPVITAPLLETPPAGEPGAPGVAHVAAAPAPAPESDPAPAPQVEPVAAPEPVSASAPEPVAAPLVPQQAQREPLVQPVPALQGTPAVESLGEQGAPAAALPPALAAPEPPAVPDVVPSIAEMVATVVRPEPAETEIPGWRAPDDPTLRVFADRLEERERRRSGSSAGARGRRRQRRLARLLVWLVAIGLIVACVILAPARLPSF